MFFHQLYAFVTLLKLCLHYTEQRFVAPKKAIQYSVNTYPISVTLHFRDRRDAASPVTEIAPPRPFLCVNRSAAIRYDFRGGAKAFRYSVNSLKGALCRSLYNRNEKTRVLGVCEAFSLFLVCFDLYTYSAFNPI